MKLNYLTLSLLVIIIFISCVVMIYHQGRKRIVNDIQQYNDHLIKFVNKETLKEVNEEFTNEEFTNDEFTNQEFTNEEFTNEEFTNEEFTNDIVENFSTINPENQLKFTKIEVLKADSKLNPLKKKLIYIQGKNLNKIKEVFFGDIQGLIVNRERNDASDDEIDMLSNLYNGLPLENYDISNIMYILPPDFMKYKDVIGEKELENIEMKFLIQQSKIVDNPDDINYTKNISLTSEASKQLDILINNKPTNSIYRNKFLKAKVQIKLTANSNIVDTIFVHLNNAQNFNKTVSFNKGNSNTIRFIVDMNNFIIPPLVLSSDSNISLGVGEVVIDYMFDDINILYPTGLFYRSGMDSISLDDNQEVNFSPGLSPGITDNTIDNWKLYISEDGSANINGIVNASDEIRVFHDNIKNLIQPTPPPREDPTEKFAAKFEIEIDKNDNDQIKVEWDIPEGVDNHIYTFMFNFSPTSGKENDTFTIKNERIAFDKSSYLFSSKRLFPMAKYNASMKTLRQDNGELLAEVKEDFIYIPDNFKKYHSHLFNGDKFEFKNLYRDGKLDYDNAEMVRTYFELSEYNKMKAQDDLLNTERKLKDIVSCSQNKLQGIKSGDDSTYSSTLSEEEKKMLDNENLIFNKKSEEIDRKIQKINLKLKDLEKLKNIKKHNDDLQIRSLKSVNDNTVLNMEVVDDNHKLVKINNNCLSFTKNRLQDDYGLKPCNLFDNEQYFVLNEINNLDEYNNLLAMNLSPIIDDPNEKIDFPFYVLQPLNSTKCVSIENSNISIKPCSSDNSVRFKGYINNNECNI